MRSGSEGDCPGPGVCAPAANFRTVAECAPRDAAYIQLWREEHPGYQRRWREAHPERVAEYRENYDRRHRRRRYAES